MGFDPNISMLLKAVIVDINVDLPLDRSGTKEKGRLFAVASNPRAPATLPRTISQDSDVQASLRYGTDDEVGSIRSGAGSVSSLPRRAQRNQRPNRNSDRVGRLTEDESDTQYSDAAESYVSVRIEQSNARVLNAPRQQQPRDHPNSTADHFDPRSLDRQSQDRHRQDRDRQDRHSQDRHTQDRHRQDPHRSLDRQSQDPHRQDPHRSLDRKSQDPHRSLDRQSQDPHSQDRHRQERHSQDRHRQDRHSQDRHTDSDSAIQRFESVDSGGSFPAPPGSNGSVSESLQYKSESASGSYKSEHEQPERYQPHYPDTQSEFSEIPQYSLGTRSNSGFNNADIQTASTHKLVDALRKSSPLNNRPVQNLPPRYIPPPMPSTSNSEREVQNLTAQLNEMRDEYDIGMSTKEKTAAQLERKDKELSALRKVLREEVKSHDDEIDHLRKLTRDKVENMKIEMENTHSELTEAHARLDVVNQNDQTDDHRKEIVVDNLKMAKQLNQFRRELDESKSELESTTRQLNDEKRMNEQISKRLETYINKVMKTG